jgi:hypothetical protein
MVLQQSALEIILLVDCHSYAETLNILLDIAPSEVNYSVASYLHN